MWIDVTYMFLLDCVIIARERRQQHHSCRDLPEDNRDFDCELHWPTQDMGF